LNLPRLSAYLTELKFNNAKPWFDEHRTRYTELRGDFVALMERVIAGVAEFDPSVAGVQAKDTLFRINRDVRFAHDKSPYKTTFSAAISAAGRHATWPIYYLQLGAEESFVAGGIYAPESAELRRIRTYIQHSPAQAQALLADTGLKQCFGGLSADGKLTRFPRGYGEGSELLKYKSFTVRSAVGAEQVPDLAAEVAGKCREMAPLHAWLRQALAWREE
jgi:uncharacterized protein (TIGR02453 family)